MRGTQGCGRDQLRSRDQHLCKLALLTEMQAVEASATAAGEDGRGRRGGRRDQLRLPISSWKLVLQLPEEIRTARKVADVIS